jgi:radical SAM protein with 4Fe4S-binding SPASM domain
LGRLHISFDSHEEELYEKIRVGAKFAVVTRNIREVCSLAAEDNVEVTASAVVMNLNYDKLAEYIDFVADLGVSSVVLQQMNYVASTCRELDAFATIDPPLLEKEIDRAIEAARRKGINLSVDFFKNPRAYGFNPKTFRPCKQFEISRSVIEQFPSICHHMARYMKIKPTGRVYPCCVGKWPYIHMGNIKQSSLEAVWNGKKYQRIREEMFTGTLRTFCRKCALRTMYR